MRRNISHAHRAVAQRAETEQVHVDGDMSEAILRALIDPDSVAEFEDYVERELDVEIERTKYVGFGVEAVIR
jgi:hypothetical protein